MKTLSFGFFIFIFSLASRAHILEGQWTGSGLLESSNIGIYRAEPVQLNFKIDGRKLYFSDLWAIVYDGIPWNIRSDRQLEIHGSELFYEGQRAGELHSDLLEVDFWDSGYHVQALVKMKSADEISYDYRAQKPGLAIRKNSESLNRTSPQNGFSE